MRMELVVEVTGWKGGRGAVKVVMVKTIKLVEKTPSITSNFGFHFHYRTRVRPIIWDGFYDHV